MDLFNDKTFNYAKYLNTKHKKFQILDFKLELDNIEVLKNNIEQSILEEFIKNEDHFIKVLRNHSEINNTINKLKKDTNEYKEISMQFQPKTPNLYSKKRQYLQNIFKNFSTNMSTYVNDERYYIYHESFNLNNKPAIGIFTNDMLFVGIKNFKNENNITFELYNAFLYSLLVLEFEEMEIKAVEPEQFAITQFTNKCVDILKEKTFNSETQEIEIKTKEEKKLKISEIVFYDETDFIDEIQKMDKSKVYNYFTNFVVNKLLININNFVIYETIEKYVEDVFILVDEFIDEVGDLMVKSDIMNDLKGIVYKNILEENIYKVVLKGFEAKIFWKKRNYKEVEKLILFIKEFLNKNDKNYSYLIDEFTKRKNEHFNLRSKICKEKITKFMNEFVKN